MPRRNPRRPDSAPPVSGAGAVTRVDWRGEPYDVRTVPGAAAGKAYRCPGCDQLIRPGMPHVGAWPAAVDGSSERRHWHTACWRARDRRRPGG